MADWHLKDLRKELAKGGWTIFEERKGDEYKISARWVLSHAYKKGSPIIEFEGLNDLKVLPIEKAYACKLESSAINLYFSKPGQKWSAELQNFVKQIG